MADRDEVQVARWAGIKERVGTRLREIRQGKKSQARLAGDLEELGYHVTQSMISRYEQGVLEVPLSLERLVGWALCCDSLTSATFHELLVLDGYYLPWSEDDLRAFDDLLRHYRTLPLVDQAVLRRKLLWHILGLDEQRDG
ncbi:MAG: helix-turn-helix transcriptional regulator [Chloroflexi bacterium]|nr:helix-turn-helix transcriptional regulator [Chloroflexota bacterium]